MDNNGKLSKVQIKGTAFYDEAAPGGRYVVKASRGNFYSSSLYQSKYVDFIVIHIDKCDAWYVIPVNEIKTVSIRIYPHKEISKGTYEKFKNAWYLL